MATVTSKAGISWNGSGGEPFGKATWKGSAVHFKNGRRIDGVSEAVWKFEVSGYPVLPRWFAAREHWIVSPKHSLDALRTVIAVDDLIGLQPGLDKALSELTSGR